MRALIVGLALSTFAASAFAAGETCTAQAAEKKLAGAAKNSFVKKCTGDAQKTCETAAAEKKLAGAAKLHHDVLALEDDAFAFRSIRRLRCRDHGAERRCA